MQDFELKNIIEALLMTSSEPLSLEKIQTVFEIGANPTREEIILALKELEHDYQNRALN